MKTSTQDNQLIKRKGFILTHSLEILVHGLVSSGPVEGILAYHGRKADGVRLLISWLESEREKGRCPTLPFNDTPQLV